MRSFIDRIQGMRRRPRYHHHEPWHVRLGPARLTGLVALVLVALAGAWFSLQAVSANGDLRRAANQAEVLQNQVVSGDDEGARATLRALQASTASARDTTDGLLWKLGSKVPFLGKNVSAVRAVSSVMDRVVDEAVPPIVEVSNQVNLDAYSPRKGRIDLRTITAIAPAVGAADTALTAAADDLADIDADGLLLPLRGPVRTIQEKVESARSVAASGDLAARLMPTMLGQEETRRYLLLIQNNAEVRATGGIAGSYAIITAKRGRISMGEQGSIQDLPPFDEPVLEMTESEKTVFTDQMVKDLRNVNVTPDFPRSGQIARAMARQGLDVDVDGVLSVDPVAMSYILAGTGPVTLPNGAVLDQGNAVEALLSQVYLIFTDADEQDDFFESAARTIFDVVASGTGQSRPVIAGLVRAADENRLMLWSSHEDEQAQIADSGLSGAFPDDDGATPHVGLYFGDAAASKMEYYFDFTTIATATRCLDDDRQEITLTAELVSTAPRGLPQRVAGYDPEIPAGEMRLITWLYAPHAGRFTDIRLDGESQLITTARLGDRSETSVPVSLVPGESRTLTATMITGPGQSADGVLSTTPGVLTTRNDSPIASACG